MKLDRLEVDDLHAGLAGQGLQEGRLVEVPLLDEDLADLAALLRWMARASWIIPSWTAPISLRICPRSFFVRA